MGELLYGWGFSILFGAILAGPGALMLIFAAAFRRRSRAMAASTP